MKNENTQFSLKKNINENIDKFVAWIGFFISDFLLEYSLNLFEKFKESYQKDPEKYNAFEIFDSWKNQTNRKNELEDKNKTQFCIESILMFLIKILFLKICEDKGLYPHSLKKITLYGKNALLNNGIEDDDVLNSIFKRIIELSPNYFNYGVLDWHLTQDKNFDKYLNRIIDFFYQFDFKNLDQDIFGNIYERCISEEKRKSLGQFYTPIEIIDYILEKTGYRASSEIENLKVIDPCCGSGSFLIRAIKKLIERYKIKYQTEIFSPDQAENVLKSITNNIYGFEINNFSCFLARMNIIFQIIDLYYLVLNNGILYRQDPFHIFNIDVLNLKFTRIEPLIGNIKFDIVVGNPPYIFIRDLPVSERERIQSLEFETSKGQWDLYQLFIEIGIKLLKERGYFGYIVPDSILANSERGIIREYIYKNCNIEIVHHVGKKFETPVVSNVILILQKTSKPDFDTETQLIFSSNETDIINKIQQREIKESWDYKFYLHLSKEDDQLIQKLKRFPTLEEIDKNNPELDIKISRGVELTKKGSIFYCSTCRTYYPLPEKQNSCNKCGTAFTDSSIETIVNEEKINENYKLFVSDLNRYKIQRYQYIEISKEGINYKNPEIYVPNRVIIRQLSEGRLICATIEPEGAYTSQSIYNINTNLNPYYLLGIINSKIISYYFAKIFGSYKTLFPRILIEYIKKLPLVLAEKNIEEQIAKLVKKILDLNKREINEGKKFCIMDFQPQIDSLIFNLYGLDLSEKLLIRNFFGED
ncbi:MAG: N-6 DNA methylase [Promethearchaeota archaeon]